MIEHRVWTKRSPRARGKLYTAFRAGHITEVEYREAAAQAGEMPSMIDVLISWVQPVPDENKWEDFLQANYPHLTISIEADGGKEFEEWFVYIKELPGCMSQGKTIREALANIQDAMWVWLQEAYENARLEGENRRYAAGYAHACGYHD